MRFKTQDGTDVEETVNEAHNLIKFMSGDKPHQGLRINNGKKMQILRSFKDDGTENLVIYGKVTKGGACIACAGKCIIIGTFDENAGHTSVGCNEIVTLMAKYLVKSKWPPGQDGEIGSGNSLSWQPYIDTMLVGKGNATQALICSKDTGALWASTPGFSLKTYEAEIPQEDGSDAMETVDEAKNLVQVRKMTLMNFAFAVIVV